jgi:uncharacterized protein YcfL
MKALALPLLIGLLALSGCASHYVMKLNSGAQITTASKPKLKENIYTFKDAKGEKRFIAAGRVREIEPASMTAQENKPKRVKVQHKHKWYFLWLA